MAGAKFDESGFVARKNCPCATNKIKILGKKIEVLQDYAMQKHFDNWLEGEVVDRQ